MKVSLGKECEEENIDVFIHAPVKATPRQTHVDIHSHHHLSLHHQLFLHLHHSDS